MANQYTIYLVRHAESGLNADGNRFAGSIETRITEAGRRQAEKLREYFKGTDAGLLISSPQQRALETAAYIEEALGVKAVKDERLRELHYGEWEGKTREEIEAQEPELFEAWQIEPTTYLPAGGESPEEAQERMVNFWKDLPQLLKSEEKASAVIVTHRTAIRILMCWLDDIPISSYRTLKMENAAVSIITTDETGHPIEIDHNKTDHLN